MKYTPPKRTLGPRATRNAADRRIAFHKVLTDPLRGMKCEGCGAADVTLQWAHVAGRPGSGSCLGVWANSSELTTALCADNIRARTVGCHSRYDRHLDAGLRRRLLAAAAVRIQGRLRAEARTSKALVDVNVETIRAETALGIIRRTVAELERLGVEPLRRPGASGSGLDALRAAS